MAAKSTKAGSSSTVSLAGNTNRFIGISRWKRSEIRKSTGSRAASGASVPARTPANSTWRKQVPSTTPVGAVSICSAAKSTSNGGLDP